MQTKALSVHLLIATLLFPLACKQQEKSESEQEFSAEADKPSFELQFVGASEGLPRGIRLTLRNQTGEPVKFMEPVALRTIFWPPPYVAPAEGPHTRLALVFSDAQGRTSELAAMWTHDPTSEGGRMPASAIHEISPGGSWSKAYPFGSFYFWGPCGPATDVASVLKPGEGELRVTATIAGRAGTEYTSGPRNLKCAPPGFLFEFPGPPRREG